MFLFLGTPTVIFCKPASTSATTEVTAFKQAIEKEEAYPSTSRKMLEDYSTTDEILSRLRIEELMKLSYRLNDWPSFYGYAFYYRKRWRIKERGEVSLLELLALMRHCQDELVLAFAKKYRKNRPEWTLALDQIVALTETRFRGKARKGRSVQPIEDYLEGTTLWNLNPSRSADFVRRLDPTRIKVKVANQCSG